MTPYWKEKKRVDVAHVVMGLWGKYVTTPGWVACDILRTLGSVKQHNAVLHISFGAQMGEYDF